MKTIDEQWIFSQPQLLKVSSRSQVVRFKYKLSKKATNKSGRDCVLKFFPEPSRPLFDREVNAYDTLDKIGNSADYVNPIAAGVWSCTKYLKALGQGILPLTVSDNEVSVLMLDFYDAPPLSSRRLTKPLAIAILKSLEELHSVGIVHGDISLENILLLDEKPPHLMWLDFSSSWTDASNSQKNWERDRALTYVSKWVYPQLYKILI